MLHCSNTYCRMGFCLCISLRYSTTQRRPTDCTSVPYHSLSLVLFSLCLPTVHLCDTVWRWPHHKACQALGDWQGHKKQWTSWAVQRDSVCSATTGRLVSIAVQPFEGTHWHIPRLCWTLCVRPLRKTYDWVPTFIFSWMIAILSRLDHIASIACCHVSSTRSVWETCSTSW